jgi:hypothetical protein
MKPSGGVARSSKRVRTIAAGARFEHNPGATGESPPGWEKEGEMSILGTTSTPRRNPARTRQLPSWRTPPRLAVLFSLVMALGSLIPYTTADTAAAPQSGAPDVASLFQATGTASLEVDVVRCPDGFDPNDLFGTCTDGIEGVDIQIVSADSTLGVDQTQTTAKPSDPGPGRTSFANLPAGDYNLTVNLAPEDGVRYYVYCGIAGGGEPLPANPDDALNTIVTVPDGQPVACDVYVIPTETEPVEESSIDLFAFTCEPGALPAEDEDGARDFEAFEAACTDAAPGVDFHLVTSDDADTLQTTGQDGRAQFTYPAGSPVRFYSGVPLEAQEWLFCSVDQDDPENITIDDTGVSTFDNATAEDRICSWFLVEPDTAATETPTEEPGATESPTEAPTDVATEQPTEAPTEVPTGQPAEDASIDLTAFTCALDAVADPGTADFSAFQEACADVAPDVDFHLNTGELQGTETTDANGRVSFTFPVGEEVDFYAAVPLGADEYLFCSVDSGDAAAIEMDDQGVAHFPNTETTAQTCSWFLIEDAPATEVPTESPTEEPTEAPTLEPTAEPTEAPTEEPTAVPTEVLPGGTGQISVLASTCPQGYDPDVDGVTYEDLSTDCTQGVADVQFTFANEQGDEDVRVTDGQNAIVFSNLDPGAYTLYSGVPLDAATEYLWCVADGGNRYQKEFSDRGVTTFGDLQEEQIECQWFIVPENSRDDETGGSLEIHLAVCPVDYTGNTIFDDCHGNGLDGYEFTLEGPGGTQTGTTQIEQEPGPGVVTFTSLAAGDYTFNGGPPGDFGKVELYCSNQPANGSPEYSIDGAMASLTLAENQHVLCDWYFIPEDGSGLTPTPSPTETPEPSRAEILVTLYSCPPAASQSGTYGGASQETFENECTEKVNDVTFRVGDPDSAPLSAKTGVSGDGAVRFFDLLPGDLTMTPSLPSNLTSAAVFCTIEDGDPYQKALSNGGTTFVNVDGESIECAWYAVEDREEPVETPTGSITIREYLCEKDRSEITDWDAECAPGSTGTSYTIANTSTGATAEGTPDDKGVRVFAGLPNGFYTLEQNTGSWCRAVADRVDSQSRVIVEGGGNTDVVLYQCNAVEGLPVTGSGPGGTITSDRTGLTGMRILAVALGLMAVPFAWTGIQQLRKRNQVASENVVEPIAQPLVDANGRIRMRFR